MTNVRVLGINRRNFFVETKFEILCLMAYIFAKCGFSVFHFIIIYTERKKMTALFMHEHAKAQTDNFVCGYVLFLDLSSHHFSLLVDFIISRQKKEATTITNSIMFTQDFFLLSERSKSSLYFDVHELVQNYFCLTLMINYTWKEMQGTPFL